MSTRIIAIDTATEACSVALWRDGVVSCRYEIRPREHTQRILPLIEEVLSESQLSLTDLDALAFGQGPGSFTGVRIGIGIAQGLSLGANLPMVGVSTLAAMAQGAHRLTGARRVIAAIDARMGEVYWGAYRLDEDDKWRLEQAECVITPERAVQQMAELEGQWHYAGTGWQSYPTMIEQSPLALISGDITLPNAVDMLPLALNAWRSGDAVAVEDAQPVYLRNEVTWKKLPGRE
jgi:tRNA threonylcarbamoyladenosine biosynthesis protein TsaB